MIPSDEIYHILEDLKKLRQERNYSKSKFNSINKQILAFDKGYHWHQDEFLDLVARKGKILGYKNIKKELKCLKSLLKFINSLLKKKEFIAALEQSKIDQEQFKKAIKFNMLKLKVLKDRNKDCRKKMQTFVKVIKITTNKKDFETALADWDTAQSKMAYIDRLEGSLENKVILEQTRKFPKNVKQRTVIWKIATAYAMATMIGFAAVTADYSVKGGISFGGGEAMAGELHDKAFYDGLAEQAEDMNKSKNYRGVIQLLDKYKNITENVHLLNELAGAYGKIGEIDVAISLFEKAYQLEPGRSSILFNLGGIYSYVKKDKIKGIKYFKMCVEGGGEFAKRAENHIKKLNK